MEVPSFWRTTGPRYQLIGEACSKCGNKIFPARQNHNQGQWHFFTDLPEKMTAETLLGMVSCYPSSVREQIFKIYLGRYKEIIPADEQLKAIEQLVQLPETRQARPSKLYCELAEEIDGIAMS